ncbi:hypothetical protein AOLI_G00178410 [Acnodon oligacanthus]
MTGGRPWGKQRQRECQCQVVVLQNAAPSITKTCPHVWPALQYCTLQYPAGVKGMSASTKKPSCGHLQTTAEGAVNVLRNNTVRKHQRLFASGQGHAGEMELGDQTRPCCSAD